MKPLKADREFEEVEAVEATHVFLAKQRQDLLLEKERVLLAHGWVKVPNPYNDGSSRSSWRKKPVFLPPGTRLRDPKADTARTLLADGRGWARDVTQSWARHAREVLRRRRVAEASRSR